MKTPIVWLVLAQWCLAACSSIKVHTRTEPGVDFGQYKTYAFAPRPPGERVYGSLLAENELMYGIGDELAARGIQADTAKPDLIVAVQSSSQMSQRQVAVNPNPMLNPWAMPMWGFYDPFFWRPGLASPWWGPRQTQTVTEREGTIEVYVFDRATKKVLWQGAGVGNANDPFENVKLTVRKLFNKFPAKARYKVGEIEH